MAREKRVGPFVVEDFRPDSDLILVSYEDHTVTVWVDEHGKAQLQIARDTPGLADPVEILFSAEVSSYPDDAEDDDGA